jgi:Rrf2 family iron-sulfur cluster assembly transcriptional regulator
MKVKKSSAYALHALMYMVRHSTQLPATTAIIAKAEGIPSEYLSKIFQQLVKANFIRAVTGKKRGYVFAKPPEEITLLELFETIEGAPLFDDCFLKHSECSGTQENCCIFSIWHNTIRQINNLLKETTVATAAWSHPQHRFLSLPISLANPKDKRKTKLIKFETATSNDKPR